MGKSKPVPGKKDKKSKAGRDSAEDLELADEHAQRVKGGFSRQDKRGYIAGKS